MLRRSGDFETRISAINRVLFSRFSMCFSCYRPNACFSRESPCREYRVRLIGARFHRRSFSSSLLVCEMTAEHFIIETIRREYIIAGTTDIFQRSVLFRCCARYAFPSEVTRTVSKCFVFFPLFFFTVCFFFPIRSTSCSVNPSYSSSGKHREFCSLLLRNIAVGTSVYSFLWLPKDTLGSCVDRQ